MELKKCKKCGQDNYLDMKFCTGCGSKFEDEDIDIKSDSTDGVYCANCGSKNSVDNKFCENCGSPLDDEAEEIVEEKPVQEEVEIVEEETSKKDEIFDEQEEILDTSTDVIYCEKCGSKNSVDNKFCENCGSPLDVETEEIIEEEPVQEEAEIVEEESPKEAEISDEQEEILDTSADVIYCTNCGSNNSVDNKFCESCGSPLDEETEKIIEEEPVQEEAEIVEETSKEAETSDEQEEILDISTDVIYCEKCGSNNSVDNKFCESCGSPLDVETEEIIEEEPVQEEAEIIEETSKEDKTYDKEEKQDDKPAVIKENINNEIKNNDVERVLENKPKSNIKKNNTKKVNVSNKKKKLIILIIIILVFSISTVCFTTYQSKHTWSKWVNKLPTNVTESKYTIEEKKQYSVKTKKTTTSSKETLKGWTLDKSNLPNTEEQEKEVSSIEEIKKFESNKDITINNKEVIEEQYEAVLCGYYSPNETSNRFYIPNNSKPYCDKDDSYTLTETISSQPKDTYKIGDDYKEKYYTNTDGNKIYYKIVSSTPVKVKYKYSNKTTDNLYHFYKWTEWSEYSDKEQKASATVKVRERTVYRYKVK